MSDVEQPAIVNYDDPPVAAGPEWPPLEEQTFFRNHQSPVTGAAEPTPDDRAFLAAYAGQPGVGLPVTPTIAEPEPDVDPAEVVRRAVESDLEHKTTTGPQAEQVAESYAEQPGQNAPEEAT